MEKDYKKLSNLIQENGFNGVVLISEQEEIVFQHAYGYHNVKEEARLMDDSIMRIASITKTFTAVLVLKLCEDKIIDIQDSISKYIPGFKHKITIHHLLSNSSGVANFSLDMDFKAILSSADILGSLIDYLQKEELHFEPGSMFEYSNSGYIIIQRVIEIVTKLSYFDCLKKYVLIPLGMNDTYMESPDNTPKNHAVPYTCKYGNIVEVPPFDMRIAGAGGGIMSTVQDIHRLNNAILNKRLLSEESTSLLFDRQIEVTENDFYGYGIIGNTFIHNEKEILRFYHSGGGFGVRSFNTIFYNENIQVILLSNLDDKDLFNKTKNMIDEFVLN